MRTLKLKWFTNQDALRPVGRYLLAAFMHRFREDLACPGIYAPNPDSQTPHYFFQLATMLKSREPWPETFEQALLEVEAMAEAAARTEPRASASGEARTDRSASENTEAASATDASSSSGTLRLGEPRSEADGPTNGGPLADARGSVDLGEAVKLWLKNHPTDNPQEVE